MFEYITTEAIHEDNRLAASLALKNIIKKVYGVSSQKSILSFVKLKICLRGISKRTFFAPYNTSYLTSIMFLFSNTITRIMTKPWQNVANASNKSSLRKKTLQRSTWLLKDSPCFSSILWTSWCPQVIKELPRFCLSALPWWARDSCRRSGQGSCPSWPSIYRISKYRWVWSAHLRPSRRSARSTDTCSGRMTCTERWTTWSKICLQSCFNL